MRSIILLFSISLILFSACDQNTDKQAEAEYLNKTTEDHINAIRDHSNAFKQDNRDCVDYSGEDFVDHIINTKLSDPSHKKYLSYRPWLKQLKPRVCIDKVMLFLDTLKNGDVYRVEVHTEVFNEEDHEVEYGYNQIISKINQIEPIGANTRVSELPKNYISDIKVTKNGVPFNIPSSSYNQFYNVKTCTFSLPQTIMDSYVDEQNDVLYIYFFNGKLGDAHFNKMVFDKNTHICNISLDYRDLKCYQKFKQNQVWF